MNAHYLGCVDYAVTFAAMKAFTKERVLQGTLNPGDQLWICEHFPVFTQGLAGKAAHVLGAGSIPIVQSDRGGQVTYHGPGQVVAYPLLDLKRAGYFVKEYVFRIEEAVLKTLAYFGVTGHRVRGAPGIYVRLANPFSHARLDAVDTPAKLGSDPNYFHRNGLGKIAALGIKVSHHCAYHGVALNVAMDLTPFTQINPCGYAGLVTTDLAQLGVLVSWQEAATVLAAKLCQYLEPRMEPRLEP